MKYILLFLLLGCKQSQSVHDIGLREQNKYMLQHDKEYKKQAVKRHKKQKRFVKIKKSNKRIIK